jgi:cytochrome bd-type quinol oxidase subunit 1
MPAKGPVSILWQIIFTFIPILDLYAFYRIKKLRKYFLYVIIPLFAITLGITFSFVLSELQNPDFSFDDESMTSESEEFLSVIFVPIEIGFQILTIYFVYTWSKRWNEQVSNTI